MSRTRPKVKAVASVRGGYSVRYTRSSPSTACMYTLLTDSDTTTHGSQAPIPSYTAGSVFRLRNESSRIFRREPLRAMAVPGSGSGLAPSASGWAPPGRWAAECLHPEQVRGLLLVPSRHRCTSHTGRWRTAVHRPQSTEFSDWSARPRETPSIGWNVIGCSTIKNKSQAKPWGDLC